jgi:hypothetical protein
MGLSLLQRALGFCAIAMLTVGSLFTLAPVHALTNDALNRALLSTVLVASWDAKGTIPMARLPSASRRT